MKNLKRLLQNDLGILCGRSNEGKTMALINIITAYQDNYDGKIWVFGMKKELTNRLGVNTFESLLELEQISDSIIIIDEVGLLFDLDNRKKKKQVDTTLRMVNHNNNKILLSGLPTDFKKYICGKSKYFLYKTLKISDLINGSDIKEAIKQYEGTGKGSFLLHVPIDKMLCYDGHYWYQDVKYNSTFDTKANNKDLFVPKNVPIKKGTKKLSKKVSNKVSRDVPFNFTQLKSMGGTNVQ